jgi:hypothetical protein
VSTTTDTQTSKALEWAVEKISVASQNGWYLDKIMQLSTSAPKYLMPGASAPAPVRAPAPPASNGSAATDDTRRQLAEATAAITSLEARVASLEADVSMLKKAQKSLSAHLEEAVGPHSEGEHKQHWWSRRHH